MLMHFEDGGLFVGHRTLDDAIRLVLDLLSLTDVEVRQRAVQRVS
jgi:hypothetical protein